MFLYSLKLLLNTFSAWEDIWRAVLKMSAEQKGSLILLVHYQSFFCQNSTEVSLACQCSVQILGMFTKIAKSNYLSLCLFARMKNLASHWAAFREIFILSTFFFKSVKNVQMPLKSDKNNGYCRLRPMYIYDNISLKSS
jgi:hypothetical protein